MEVAAEMERYYRSTQALTVRTIDGREFTGRVVFLDEHVAEIHPAPRHPRNAAIPRHKVRVQDVAHVGPAPRRWCDRGAGRSLEELRALVER